jgi:hypothetical protein
MKQIKDYELKALKLDCVSLISKTYLELGQKSDADTIVTLSTILSDDLIRDFKSLYFEDIIESFRIGVRKTDKFHLNVKTYYHWILAHRKTLWDATYQVRTLNQDPKQVPYYREQTKLLTNKS